MVAQGRIRSFAVGTSGVIATASAAAGLWVVFFPSGGNHAAATAVGGTVRVRDLVPAVTLASFLHENGMPLGKSTKDQLQLRGAEAFVQVRLSGVTSPPSLSWTLFQRHPRIPLGGSFAHQNGGAVPTLSNAYSGVAKVWLPWPSHPGVYFARIELDYKNATLDFRDSPPFGVTGIFTPPITGTTPTTTTTPQPEPPPPIPIPHVAAVFKRS